MKPSIGQAGKDSAEIVRSVRSGELDSTFRVYRREWLFDSRHPSEEAAQQHGQERYGGRLEDLDISVRPDTNGRDHVLWVRKWNVHSEWKDEEAATDARAKLQAQGDVVMVVTRNSRQEHMLLQYGVLKLSNASS